MSTRKKFEADMARLDRKIAFWYGFTVGALLCGAAILLSFVVTTGA